MSSRVRAVAVGLAAAAWLGFRSTLAQRSALVGRLGLMALILTLWSRLWRAAGDPFAATALGGAAPAGAPPLAVALTWYVFVTEWVVLSVPQIHLEVERDVQTGDLTGWLVRPLPYGALKIALGVGSGAATFLGLGVLGSAIVALVTGGALAPWRDALMAAPFVATSIVALTAMQAAIGFLALVMADISPVYWVYQKLLFLLGGLLVPLALYPPWLERLARWTPFPAVLGDVARRVLEARAGVPSPVPWALGAWTLGSLAAAALAWRLAVRRVDVSGG